MNLNDKVRINEQFKYYVFLSVFYAILMVTAQSVAYRLIQIGPFLEPGGIFIFPATFAISDVISEAYGPTLARKTIFIALFAQAFYSIIPIGVNMLPSPSTWNHRDAYDLVFGSSWLVFASNLAAVLVGMIFNTQLIGKTKIIARGKFFKFRSFFSCAIGELILTTIIVSIALVPVEGFQMGKHLFINMYLFKIGFSLLFLYPASFLVVALKKLDGADVYETKVSINPWSSVFRRNVEMDDNVVNIFGK